MQFILKFYHVSSVSMFKNKNILVTGGTGSFGSHFIKYVLNNYDFRKLIIFSRDELKQFELRNELSSFKNYKKLRFFVGDIRDKDRLKFATKNIDILIHAAALKQVSTAEYNPFEVIKTNIIGSQNVVECSIENKIKKIIALSTDKASAPINLYGATKLTSDKLFISANDYSGLSSSFFSVVRYGNVFGSRGSVAPYFKDLLKKNMKISITDENMTRFNITIDDGVKFVIESLKNMRGGEIFIPKLKSFKVIDLANAITTKNNIIFIGKRRGEKVHESMFTIDECDKIFEYKNYYVMYDSFDKKKHSKIIRNKIKKPFNYSSENANEFLSKTSLKKLFKSI